LNLHRRENLKSRVLCIIKGINNIHSFRLHAYLDMKNKFWLEINFLLILYVSHCRYVCHS
jgi:hypothetical protein